MLLAAYGDLPRLAALDALNQLDVADYPHLKAEDRVATLRRLWQRAGLNDPDGERYDQHGRLIIDSAAGFIAWAASNNLAGVVAA